MPEGSCLRVAVVGLGIGGAHADGFLRLPEQFEIACVADPDPQRLVFVTEWLGCAGVNDLEAVLERDDIDVVSLATPPHLHFEQIARVLETGRHVICEKPLVGSLDAVDRLAELEGASSGQLMPIYQYRFGRGLQKLKHLVEEGLAGRPYTSTVDLAWRRRSDYYEVPWRGRIGTELGGVLLSHALHAIDMVTYVQGGVSSVFARTATRVNEIETEDCASVSLAMADGSLATFSATLGSAEEITRHRFCFEHLTAESNTSPYENHREPWIFTGDSEDDDQRIKEALGRFVPRPELYKGQFARFADTLAAGGEPPVTVADARAGLEIVTACYVSATEHRDVELPFDTDHPAYHGWTTCT
jgi:predicted dehydrogenase